MWEMRIQFLGWEDPLGKEMASHSSILAWEIPWTVEPGGLQSMELQRVTHNLVTTLHLFFLILFPIHPTPHSSEFNFTYVRLPSNIP